MALGVDLGGTTTTIALVDHRGTLQRSVRLPSRYTSGDDLLGHMSATIDAWQLEGSCRPCSVGLGLPGLVDVDAGMLLRCPKLPQLEGYPLRSSAEARLRLPVVLDNDVHAAALAEARLGAARECRVAFCLTLGTGLGGAVVVGGQVVRGAGGLGGEIGHLRVTDAGSECDCGGRGCLQTEVNARAIVRRYREHAAAVPDLPDDAAEVARRAEVGDECARKALADCGRQLGRGLAIVINLLNPDCIVVGGGIAGAGRWLLEPASEAARGGCWPQAWACCAVQEAELGRDAGVVGAGLLALEKQST